MKKLEKWLKILNLLFTDTCKKDDFYEKNFDINKEKPNINDSISIFDLIVSFNKLYLDFMKEYSELDKLELGKYIEIGDFRKENNSDGDGERILNIYIDEPKITNHENTILHIYEVNGEIDSFVTKAFKEDDDYYDNVHLDNDKLKRYLDLFEKYDLLFKLYYYLRSNHVFADGMNLMYTRIESPYENLLCGLNNININICSSYWMGPDNKIDVTFNLGDNFDIDFTKCSLTLEDESLYVGIGTYINILKSIYINGKYLNCYNDGNDQEKINKQMKILRKVNK